jgi:hypothetical protein
MTINFNVINSDLVIVSTKYRIKAVTFAVATQLFEVIKLQAIKRINNKLYIKVLNDLIDQ